MFLLTPHCRTLTTATLLFAGLCCGTLQAQDDAQKAVTAEAIQQWIKDLGSRDFKIRQTATAELLKADDAAVAPLKQAEKTGSSEQKLRIQSILRALEQNSFENRLAVLKQTPAAKTLAGMPDWNRFSQIVGDDAKSIDLYIRLLSAEPVLFTAAMKRPGELRNLLKMRSSELLLAARPAAIRTIKRQQFSVDSYAALLLLASDDQRILENNTSTNISTLLEWPAFTEAFRQDDGKRYLRLVGTYILRKRIGVVLPLEFARRHPLREGLVLARQVLKTALRGHNGRPAMMLLMEQGNVQDLALLESLFDNRGFLVRGLKNAPEYIAYNGDLALATTIVMRDQDPHAFGFDPENKSDGKFRFTLETIGFTNNQDRVKAHQKYAAQFLKKPQAAGK